MKQSILFSLSIILSHTVLYAAQEVKELTKPKLTKEYLNIEDSIDTYIKNDPTQAIYLLNRVLNQTENSYERFNLIFWGLSFAYAKDGKQKECFDILKKGQNEGFFYPFITGSHYFPEYLNELKKLEGFDDLIIKNDQLKKESQATSVPEYIIELPAKYSTDKKYPLLLTFTGGFGSHINLSKHWHSSKLKEEYIVAHLQGVNYHGSYLKSYDRQKLSNIISMYNDIAKKYPVDTTQIILAAQSAGAYFTLKLASEQLIPVKGIILAFPHIPGNTSFINYEVLETNKVSISIMGGELDPRIVRVKFLSVEFDKNGINNRLIIFARKGHEFPDDFQHQLDLSMDFICMPISTK